MDKVRAAVVFWLGQGFKVRAACNLANDGFNSWEELESFPLADLPRRLARIPNCGKKSVAEIMAALHLRANPASYSHWGMH